jgi:F-type H+-transporting ATPase subunit b
MEDIAKSLDLNWALIITQVIGFLIALWILKAFAWKPLLGMLEARRKKIADDLGEAEKVRSDADRLLDEYRGKLRDIDNEARTRIQEAVSEANRISAEIRESAREESKQIIARSREELARDIAKARVQLRDDIAGMAMRAAEKVISAHLDDAEQKRLLDDFLREVDTA